MTSLTNLLVSHSVTISALANLAIVLSPVIVMGLATLVKEITQ